MATATQATKRPHEFGPWLDPVTVFGKGMASAPFERRCRKCSAKEWLEGGGSSVTYGNDRSRESC